MKERTKFALILAVFAACCVLGPELGIARAVGAMGFAVIIGLLMQFIFRQEAPLMQGKAFFDCRSLLHKTLKWQNDACRGYLI